MTEKNTLFYKNLKAVRMQYAFLLGLSGMTLPSVAFAAQCKALHHMTKHLPSTSGPRSIEKRQITWIPSGIQVYGANDSQIRIYDTRNELGTLCERSISVANSSPYGVYTGYTGCNSTGDMEYVWLSCLYKKSV